MVNSKSNESSKKQTKTPKKTNAQRFLFAYNQLDNSLRSIYSFKRSLTFSDIIRRAVSMNSVIRKYEETLVDYGRLRNSIIHRSNPNYIIAEPHDDVVEEFEKIVKLVATPPLALDKVCRRNVLCLDHDATFRQAMELIASSGYSAIPVYNVNKLLGVAYTGHLLKVLGSELLKNVDIQDYIDKTLIEGIVTDEKATHYEVADRNLTIESALNMFYMQRKLNAIIITQNGTKEELPLGIITAADVLDMNEILDNYE